MIITDGLNEFRIRDDMLSNVDNGIIINPLYDYWNIELFIEKKNNKFVYILKKFPEAGDILKKYKIIESNDDKLLLVSSDDYSEIKMLYDNMLQVDSKRKYVIIKSVAELFAYECYQNYYLEGTVENDPNIIYLGLEFKLSEYLDNSYKKEIWEKTKEILKINYYLNLDKVIDRGMELWK